MGARAYRYLSLYQPSYGGGLVEIGSERGEGSTAWLAAYAQRHGLHFLTADVDPDVHRAAMEIAPEAALNMSGVEMLMLLNRRSVCIAYLDGFDWIPKDAENEPWIADQRARYRQLGMELDNETCQAEHLREAELLAPLLRRRCVVICDDTWLEDGEWTGKGGLAVPFLIERGLEVVDHAGCEPQSLGYVVMQR